MRIRTFCVLMGAVVIATLTAAYTAIAYATGFSPWLVVLATFGAFVAMMTLAVGIVRQLLKHRVIPDIEGGLMAAIFLPTLAMAEAIPGVYDRIVRKQTEWDTTSLNFASMFLYLVPFLVLAAFVSLPVAVAASLSTLAFQVWFADRMNATTTD